MDFPTAPTVTVAAPIDVIDRDLFGSDSCSICLDPFTPEDPVMGTKCGHGYHLQCILQWAQRSTECPLCCGCLEMTDPFSQELMEGEQAAHQRIVDEERALEESRVASHMDLERFLLRLSMQASMIAAGGAQPDGQRRVRVSRSGHGAREGREGRENPPQEAAAANPAPSRRATSQAVPVPRALDPSAAQARGDGASPSRTSTSAPEPGVSLDVLRSRVSSFSAKAKEKVSGQVTKHLGTEKGAGGSGAGGLKGRLRSLFNA